jgi:lipopolysaccharide export system permease protein
LQPGIFNSDFDGFVIYVENVDRERGLLARVLMADERDPDGRTVVFASSGRITADDNEPTIFLQLLDGTSIQEEHDAETYEVTDFESFEVRLQSDAAVARLSGDTERPQDLSWSQLRRVRRERRERGEAIIEPTIEIHSRLALAAASLFLAAIAVPLGLQRARSVRARGFVVCGAVVLGYYLMLSVSTTLARQGYLPPAMGPWIPNLALAVLAIALARRSARSHPGSP